MRGRRTRNTLLPALHHAAKHTINSHKDREIRKNNVYVFLFTTYGSTGCSTNEEFPDARALFYTAGEKREFYHLSRFAHGQKIIGFWTSAEQV
jgi:hypothetical protein